MKHTDRRPSLAMVSSEPLTERRADWVTVPRNSTIVITKSMHILISPIRETPDNHISRILLNVGESQYPGWRNGGIFHSRGRMQKQLMDKRGRQEISSPSLSSSAFTVGSTVRATITIPDRTVLCCTIMEPFLFSGMDDGTIHVWNMDDSVLSEVLRTGRRPVLAMLTISEAGILISATSASTVTAYRMTSDRRFEASFVVCCEGKGDVMSLARVGTKIFAGSSDAKVRCVIEDIFSVETSSSHEREPSIDTSSDRSSSFADIPRVYDAHDFPSRGAEATHYGFVFAMTSCLEGRYLCTGSGDGLLRVWDMVSEECVQTRDDHAGAILALAAYEVVQGVMLFSGSRDCSVKVWVWDGENGFICKRTLRKHKDEVVFLTRFGDKLVSGSADGHVCVWCTQSLALLCQYRDNTLKAGAVSLNSKLLFTSSDEGTIYVRDILLTERDLGRRDSLSRTSTGEYGFNQIESISDAAEQGYDDVAPNEISPGHVVSKDAIQCGLCVNPTTSAELLVSEVHEELDETETLVPGVTNEMILAPPMSPVTGCDKTREELLSTILTEKESAASSSKSSLEERGKFLDPSYSRDRAGNEGILSSQSIERRLIQDTLARFLSFPTVSGTEEHWEDCWQGARYIGTFLEGLGASVKYFSTTPGKNPSSDSSGKMQISRQSTLAGSNPIVLAKFASSNPSAKTVTFYGHYDVMPVDSTHWRTDPWTLTAIDGYYYGRGATDNKGPIIAMIFAIKKLLEESAEGLKSNFVFILQGEGETSNAGFKECVKSHLHWFENTSLVLTSNSYWLGEEKPCITYGFRGLIELNVSVTGASRNLHSGVDGGAIFEPMTDLVAVLGTMTSASGGVRIPGFFDDVRPPTAAEKKLLQDTDFTVEEYRSGTGVSRFTSDNATEILESRWTNPSISITSIETSNASGFYSVVPRKAEAKISIRFVPDQNPSKIENAVAAHLQSEIEKRRSPNAVEVECVNKGDWWLGDPSCRQFQIAERAVRAVWGIKPVYVREGGSMPLFSYLVKTLQAPLVQIPLGQSSDGAHLPNERIRSINLFRGKEVLQRIVRDFAETSK
ncbi:unnamed protein product [Chondrus crispus]|uniref:Peptidase M20 dimerisation domain-containing protein n=1 Tax=Chondrus crispus TaxID=2769 RepID=R7QGC1_CHOCR|nr:unnamed protein product [Chondrus crispus]CDF36828.1 unnamed protein product [Chondrus crispus]|eukprot:XP_005716647.1 unnamed protein product [Chondrus crispus]